MTVIVRKPTREERQAAARLAGAKGRSAAPMHQERRAASYGASCLDEMTPAQRRRSVKKARALSKKDGPR